MLAIPSDTSPAISAAPIAASPYANPCEPEAVLACVVDLGVQMATPRGVQTKRAPELTGDVGDVDVAAMGAEAGCA